MEGDFNRETGTEVYFLIGGFYSLDNFSAHTVELWGLKFPTAEHAFQWKKFSDTRSDIAKKVLEAGSPEIAKRIAASEKLNRSPSWNEDKVTIMEEILRAKLAQHEEVREVLVKTGSRTIIENSPGDGFWGTGSDGRGENMIGKIWMKIRDNI